MNQMAFCSDTAAGCKLNYLGPSCLYAFYHFICDLLDFVKQLFWRDKKKNTNSREISQLKGRDAAVQLKYRMQKRKTFIYRRKTSETNKKKKHNRNLSGDTNSNNTDIPAIQTFVVTLVFLHRKT